MHKKLNVELFQLCMPARRVDNRIVQFFMPICVDKIHYIKAGNVGPWIFLFHETPLSSWEFKLTMPFFAPYARIVAFDTPGYGQSDSPPGPINIRGYANRLSQAIEYFHPDNFIIGAVHTGSSIALELIRYRATSLKVENVMEDIVKELNDVTDDLAYLKGRINSD